MVYPEGEEVERDSPLRNDFYAAYNEKEDFSQHSFTVELHQSEHEPPPKRYTTENVKLHSTLDFNLKHLGYDDLEDHKGKDGRKYKQFNYTIQIVPSGASTELSIYVQGQKVGSQTVSIKLD
ncbi:uncharacterized protein N7483_006193 [Penicillium malachiteum]|uniref:uncharacterized protein n=1 Tax=Penicillium malachiteum TaxID=1324776 RepID=UPI0025487CCB|nr:uncharacterized protein N7483_006193 [Penicillium malachiteum]KAJ5731685.1 hypothetical protein N7483_006193 [Penicillium malachiteum]